MFQNILCSYVPFRKNNNNLVKLEIKLSLETENSCDIIINTTLSVISDWKKKRCQQHPRFSNLILSGMITASYKSTWCNSNPASMHKGGYHLWKSDCCLLNHVNHLTWNDNFLHLDDYFLSNGFREERITILFRKNCHFKQIESRDSKGDSIRFSQMMTSKRDD